MLTCFLLCPRFYLPLSRAWKYICRPWNTFKAKEISKTFKRFEDFPRNLKHFGRGHQKHTIWTNQNPKKYYLRILVQISFLPSIPFCWWCLLGLLLPDGESLKVFEFDLPKYNSIIRVRKVFSCSQASQHGGFLPAYRNRKSFPKLVSFPKCKRCEIWGKTEEKFLNFAEKFWSWLSAVKAFKVEWPFESRMLSTVGQRIPTEALPCWQLTFEVVTRRGQDT